MVSDNKTTALTTFATLEDVPQLEALVNKAYRGESATRGWTSEAHLLDGTRIDAATLAEYIADSNSVILKFCDDKGNIVGCVHLQLKETVVYLGMLSVDPNQQDRGIGKHLLKQAEFYASDHGRFKMQITVLDTRTELIAWYQRYGYKQTGEIRPFPTETKFGLPKQPLQLMVMEKVIDI